MPAEKDFGRRMTGPCRSDVTPNQRKLLRHPLTVNGASGVDGVNVARHVMGVRLSENDQSMSNKKELVGDVLGMIDRKEGVIQGDVLSQPQRQLRQLHQRHLSTVNGVLGVGGVIVARHVMVEKRSEKEESLLNNKEMVEDVEVMTDSRVGATPEDVPLLPQLLLLQQP